MTFIYTCTGCKERPDPYDLAEFGHVCDGWWEEHGVYDSLPKIHVAFADTEFEIAP